MNRNYKTSIRLDDNDCYVINQLKSIHGIDDTSSILRQCLHWAYTVDPILRSLPLVREARVEYQEEAAVQPPTSKAALADVPTIKVTHYSFDEVEETHLP